MISMRVVLAFAVCTAICALTHQHVASTMLAIVTLAVFVLWFLHAAFTQLRRAWSATLTQLRQAWRTMCTFIGMVARRWRR